MTIPRNLSFLAQGASSTGVLSVPYGGTGLTTLTVNYIPYGNGTGALASSSNLTFDGTILSIGSGTTGVFAYTSGALGTYRNNPNYVHYITNLTTSGACGFTTFQYGSTPTELGSLSTQDGSGFTVKGNNYLTFITGSTERLRIDSNGNLGLGTTSPSNYGGYKTIGINGTTGGVYELFANGTLTGQFYNDATGVRLRTVTAVPLVFDTNTTERMRIFSSGGVSIGNTTDPGATNLSVTGKVTAPNLQGPAFSAYATSNQSLSGAANTKVLFDTEEYDTNNNFASSRFTPTVAGYYQLNAGVRPNNTNAEAAAFIYKNGSAYKGGSNVSITIGTQNGISISTLAYANGTTDYFEVYVYLGSAGTSSGNSTSTWFNGVLVRSA